MAACGGLSRTCLKGVGKTRGGGCGVHEEDFHAKPAPAKGKKMLHCLNGEVGREGAWKHRAKKPPASGHPKKSKSKNSIPARPSSSAMPP